MMRTIALSAALAFGLATGSQAAMMPLPVGHDSDLTIKVAEGCAYRRVLQRWLGRDSLATLRVLELASYHAIVACATAGAGIALMPESVLDTMPEAKVLRHPIPKAQGLITTPLVWRRGEISPSVLALRTLVADLPKQKSAA